MVSALIANDTPRQALHLMKPHLRAVREIALRIAIKAGVPLTYYEVSDIQSGWDLLA